MAKEGASHPPAASLLEPGDRFALVPMDDGARLAVPAAIGELGEPVENVEDVSGKTLIIDRARNTLIVGPGGARHDLGTLWLEFQALVR